MFKPPSNRSEEPSKEFHGCKILLRRDRAGVIHHLNWGEIDTTPTIRSYSDGIKVGCTFLTSSALKSLYEWHTDFIGKEESKTHQRSAYAED